MSSKLPRASHTGRVSIGKWGLHAFNLDNGVRLFDGESFETVLSVRRGESPGVQFGKISEHPLMKDHAFAGSAGVFERPISFKTTEGVVTVGYDSEELISLSIPFEGPRTWDSSQPERTSLRPSCGIFGRFTG
jgi:hypothetical protein